MVRTDPQFNVRIPAELKQQMTSVSEMNKRSINAKIIAILQLWMKVDIE